MTKRYVEFDTLRTVALGMILACHFIRSVGFHRLDIPFGAVGNMIFFVMSGWLLGLAWENRGHPTYGWPFLKRRIIRLAVPLWLFAIPYMIWFKVSGHSFAAKDMILNLFLLNWLARIPGLTPYWFITAISAFYILVIALTRIKLQKNHPFVLATILATSAMLVQIALSSEGICHGYILVMMLCSALSFLNARTLLRLIRGQITSPVIVFIKSIVCTTLFVSFWRLVCSDVIITGTPLCYYSTIPIVLLVISLVFSLPVAIITTPIMTFISSISYEVYLVHAAMLLWMKPISGNIAVYALTFFAGSFLLAILLHHVSSRGINIIRQRGVHEN